MDSDNELAKAKWLFAAGLIFLVSGCLSWGEIIYLVSGKNAQANITKAYEVSKRGRFGRETGKKLTVEYAFVEPDGTARIGTETVSTDWAIPADGKVDIRYTAGADGSSRIAGNVSWIAVIVFLLSAGCVALFAIKMYNEAHEETSGRSGKRK